jgi:hypothetical protein
VSEHDRVKVMCQGDDRKCRAIYVVSRKVFEKRACICPGCGSSKARVIDE